MSYNSNIPQPSDIMAQSQSQILANFQALAPYGAGYSWFTLQSAAPTFSAGVDGLYNLNYATTATNELYCHLQRTAPANAPADIPMTASKMSNTAMVNCVSGWTYLPSGLLVKWGNGTATSSAAFTVNVGSISGGPNFNQVFQVYLTPWWGNTTVTAYSTVLTATGISSAGNFNMFVTPFDAVNSQFSYMVIGV